jgi:hypothetical protein
MRFLAVFLVFLSLFLYITPGSAQVFNLPAAMPVQMPIQQPTFIAQPQMHMPMAMPGQDRCLIIEACTDGIEEFYFNLGRLSHRHVYGSDIGMNPTCAPEFRAPMGAGSLAGFYISLEGDFTFPRQWVTSQTMNTDVRFPATFTSVSPSQVSQISGLGQTSVMSNSVIQAASSGSTPSGHRIRVCPGAVFTSVPGASPMMPMQMPAVSPFIQPIFTPQQTFCQPRRERRGLLSRIFGRRRDPQMDCYTDQPVYNPNQIGMQMPTAPLGGFIRPLYEAEESAAELNHVSDEAQPERKVQHRKRRVHVTVDVQV